MSTFLYFAYGSNLLNARLQNRCASARPIGIAQATGFSINYGMVADDAHGGSGKMTIFRSDNKNDAVHGVVYELNMDEAPVLDKFEGLNKRRPQMYTRESAFGVEFANGERVDAVTYMTAPNNKAPLPYQWYWALCLSGAIENDLPKSHQQMLANCTYKRDPHANREGKLEAEMLLRRSGYAHLIEDKEI